MPSPHSVYDQAVQDVIADARRRANDPNVPAAQRPTPSPADWRDLPIYFLLLDRFDSTTARPAEPWNQKCGVRQGGTFAGVRSRLPYLQALGVGAVWLSPVVRNSAGGWLMTYHGYAAQDFLAVDERWASDGTRATAEQELKALVDDAHARGMFVILDMVLNHTGTVFFYDRGGSVTSRFSDRELLDRSRDGGDLPGIVWTNGFGQPVSAWRDALQPGQAAHPDDAILPVELRDSFLFRRRGAKVTDSLSEFPQLGFVPGDFDIMRQIVFEYVAADGDARRVHGRYPVLSLLLRAYQYLVARFDLDGMRVDTVKYVDPKFIQRFGTAMDEFACSIGKKNFFIFGEVWDDNTNIARFVGRNGQSEPGGGFGIDAALDFPLADGIRDVCTGLFDGRKGVNALRDIFDDRRNQQEELISSHGDASSFFVTFVDNHDRHQRIRHPRSPDAEVRLCLGLLFTLPGIPCVYYGTEQDLSGAVAGDGKPTLDAFESVREALWGKFQPAPPAPFAQAAWPQDGDTFRMLQALADLRSTSAALRYGRWYFRQVSGDGASFDWSMDRGGIIAFSRINSDEEVLVVATPNPFAGWTGWVEVDPDLSPPGAQWRVAFSTLAKGGGSGVTTFSSNPVRRAVKISLASNELVVLART